MAGSPSTTKPVDLMSYSFLIHAPGMSVDRRLDGLVRCATRTIAGRGLPVLDTVPEVHPGDPDGCWFYYRDARRQLAVIVLVHELTPTVSRVTVTGVNAHRPLAAELVAAFQAEFGSLLTDLEPTTDAAPLHAACAAWTQSVQQYLANLDGNTPATLRGLAEFLCLTEDHVRHLAAAHGRCCFSWKAVRRTRRLAGRR